MLSRILSTILAVRKAFSPRLAALLTVDEGADPLASGSHEVEHCHISPVDVTVEYEVEHWHLSPVDVTVNEDGDLTLTWRQIESPDLTEQWATYLSYLPQELWWN